MNSQKGFSLPIILAIVAVVLVGAGIATFLYITNNTNPRTQSSAYTPNQLNVKTPKPDSEIGFKPGSTPSATATAPATPPPAPSAIPAGQINTSTALSADQKSFTINFLSSTNFAGITAITYNLTYTSGNTPRAVTGTFNIAGSTIATNSYSQQAIQKILTIGTCSSGTCVYDPNPTGFRLSVSTK